MRREELIELAKQNGIDLNAVELTDAELEAVVGGLDKGGGGGGGGFGDNSGRGQLSKLVRGSGSTNRW